MAIPFYATAVTGRQEFFSKLRTLSLRTSLDIVSTVHIKMFTKTENKLKRCIAVIIEE